MPDAGAVAISSVLLCWNRLPLSKRCLRSYLDTTTVPHELVLVDNASTDGTREWAESIRGTAGVAEVLHTDRNDPAAALNTALERCRGRYLHIMENDYLYLPGWDGYVLDRFERLADLGQLSIGSGSPAARGEHHRGLVFLATANVGTSSVLSRELFFETGVRVHGHYRGGVYPDDYDLSHQIRLAGKLVAWPDRPLAHHLGGGEHEFRRDPAYYVRNYRLKLLSLDRLRGSMRRWVRGDFRDTTTLLKRFLYAFAAKYRR